MFVMCPYFLRQRQEYTKMPDAFASGKEDQSLPRSRSQLGRERAFIPDTTPMATNRVIRDEPP